MANTDPPANASSAATDSLHPEDAAFLRWVESGEVTAECWHHKEHIKLAFLYVVRHGEVEALERMRVVLHRVNAAQGVPDALDRGYHETVTVAWLRLVAMTVAEYGPAATAEEFVQQQEHLMNRRALRFFYTRGRIMTATAKRTFVEPDLTPLPVSPGRSAAASSA